MAGRLEGRNAIITGGGAGIGLAIARAFGRAGASVAIVDLDAERAEAAEAELRREGITALVRVADVTDGQSVAPAFGDIIDRFGGTLHVLVNNAGIAEFAGLEDSTLESWNHIFAVNVTGAFLCCRAALPAMKREGGAIVNMASIAGLIGIPRMPAYCASKAALIGLTRQLAVDYSGQGIRVNCICPGRIAGTELDRWIMALDSEAVTQTKMAKYPIGRFGRPEEIAEAALFLASAESGFVTGTALTVDGGMTAL
jgi:NAD(P)-dependent dehydrogenase (short-subunit alcohol dehydrogenase family)